jgi:uncharacterized protein YqeY
MSLRSTIVEAQKEAMKAKDAQTLAVVRLVFAAIRNSEIDKGRELDDEEVIAIVRSQNKQLNDAIKDFESGARQDLIDNAKSEIEVLKRFLPAELSDEEIRSVIQKIMTQSPDGTVGQLIGVVMKELKGKADGNRVRALVEEFSPKG